MLARLFLVVLLVFSATAQDRPADNSSGAPFYSLEKEATLGATLARDVRERSRAVESPSAQAYVEGLGRRLGQSLPADGPVYTFEILASEGNSLRQPGVLPGGYVFVPASLFAAAESEAEFAGVLAHAMAHAALRHGGRGASRGEVINIASVPLIFLGDWNGIDGRSSVVPMALASRAREFEIEADRVAAQALAQAGYDPAALVRYLGRMQAEGDTNPGSPLPPREKRLDELARLIATLPPVESSGNDDEFMRVREQVGAVAPAPNR